MYLSVHDIVPISVSVLTGMLIYKRILVSLVVKDLMFLCPTGGGHLGSLGSQGILRDLRVGRIFGDFKGILRGNPIKIALVSNPKIFNKNNSRHVEKFNSGVD